RIKVMLDGQGADEYLAGYFPSFNRLIGGYLRKLRIAKAFEALGDHASRRSDGRRDLVRSSLGSGVHGERQLYGAASSDLCSRLGFDGDLAFELRTFHSSRLKQYLY